MFVTNYRYEHVLKLLKCLSQTTFTNMYQKLLGRPVFV